MISVASSESLSVAIFSIRESPSPKTPARSQALAISWDPRAALVTPVTEMPTLLSRSTSARALWYILSRSISNRGPVRLLLLIVFPRFAEMPLAPSLRGDPEIESMRR